MTPYQKQQLEYQRQAKVKAIAITATQGNTFGLQLAAIAAVVGLLLTLV